MSIVIDSNSPYYEQFTEEAAKHAVYMVGEDPLFGQMMMVVYQTPSNANHSDPRLSSLLISTHGTSGFIDMTLDHRSRYYAAVNNLPPLHRSSLVRQALAVTCLRSFATMEKYTQQLLARHAAGRIYDWDETTAGATASHMEIVNGKYPDEIEKAMRRFGVLEPKFINTEIMDVVYVDSDKTIEKNNELVYLLGDQLEQLFDPLSEYSPEPTERLYSPPPSGEEGNQHDPALVQNVCDELRTLQQNFRNDLIDFLQEFLIPLRVEVLDHTVQGLSVRKLNTVFPPTIDEIVRINNLFYEALEQAAPFGSFEVIKACGMTVPYFYKACMRHEAATRTLSESLREFYPLVKPHLQPATAARYTARKIEALIHCSLHLARVKLIVERLVKMAPWTADQQELAQEYYESAVGTIDAFGRAQSCSEDYDRRVFTPTGKVLVEMAEGWPKELEYGWINRRVVTIFDAVDLLSEKQDVRNIVIVFTDELVILEPDAPIPLASTSGVHIPSIGDVLMHSMINEVPLTNVPPLKVVAWAPIEEVHMSEYNNSKGLCVSVSGHGLRHRDGSTKYVKLYQLVRPDHLAATIIDVVAKAKVLNKTQPFHLFKSNGPQLTLYATVHELQGYAQEVHKTPVALFMNLDVTREVLDANGVSACFKVSFSDESHVRVEAFTKFNGMGEFDHIVHRNEFAKLINSEAAYLYTLHYSAKNKDLIGGIIEANREITAQLIRFSTTASVRRANTHTKGKAACTTTKKSSVATLQKKRQTILSVVEEGPEELAPVLADNEPKRKPSLTKRRSSPASLLAMLGRKNKKEENSSNSSGFKFLRGKEKYKKPAAVVTTAPLMEGAPDMSHSDSSLNTISSAHTPTEFQFPPVPSAFNKRQPSQEFRSMSEWEDLEEDAETISSIGMSTAIHDTQVVMVGHDEVEEEEEVGHSSFVSSVDRAEFNEQSLVRDMSSIRERLILDRPASMETVSMQSVEIVEGDKIHRLLDSEEEREQRDVYEWFTKYEHEAVAAKRDSLSSFESSIASFEKELLTSYRYNEALQQGSTRQLARFIEPRHPRASMDVSQVSSGILDQLQAARFEDNPYPHLRHHYSQSISANSGVSFEEYELQKEVRIDDAEEAEEIETHSLATATVIGEGSKGATPRLGGFTPEIGTAPAAGAIGLAGPFEYDSSGTLEVSANTTYATEQEEEEDEEEDTLNIADDFRYLAGLVGDVDPVSESMFFGHRHSASMATIKQELSGLSTSESRKLWPDLRNSSIMFLGSYVREKDSDSGMDPFIKHSDSAELSALQVPHRGSGELAKIARYRQAALESNYDSYYSEESLDDWAARAEDYVTSSSVGELQLAAFTVEIGRLVEYEMGRQDMSTASALSRTRQLEGVKATLVSLYDRVHAADAPKVQLLAWTLIGLADTMAHLPQGTRRYDSAIRGLLDVEWHRRSKLPHTLTN
ncbi:hypothetical protein TRVA0_016S01640 [Trichomonascus vanleenenianus]|uniref:Bud3p n=1 Tax=Trichomonascus vanleenenianus TaxID=2268995 RepID=UPI003ECB262F